MAAHVTLVFIRAYLITLCLLDDAAFVELCAGKIISSLVPGHTSRDNMHILFVCVCAERCVLSNEYYTAQN